MTWSQFICTKPWLQANIKCDLRGAIQPFVCTDNNDIAADQCILYRILCAMYVNDFMYIYF